ncbi:MAG: hypothetical protein ABI779_14225 [Acidobacteriota bacterium]
MVTVSMQGRDVPDDFPGADLVREGLRDLAAGVETVPALLVLVGAPRLRDLGFEVSDPFSNQDHPEHRLYDLLSKEDEDEAHSRYNALLRRLISFERAAECVSD